MSLAERSTQLWAFLTGMGLHVDAVRRSGDEDSLVALAVSLEPMPFRLTVADSPPEIGANLPVQREKMAGRAASPSGNVSNLVDFPAKV